MEMEGDAVPFLASKANQGPTALKRLYLSAVAKLPRKLRKWLPPGRPDPREPAIRLLGGIGQIQKTKLWSGRPSQKPSAALALPAIQAALRDPEMRRIACEAIEDIGPPARAAVPDLLALAASDYGRREVDSTVMRALAEIGPAASNAVPLLIQIVGDTNVPGRILAAPALGGIGAAARSAGPAVGALLVEQQDQGGAGLVMVMARIGGAPSNAVPVLERLTREGNPLRSELATVALWERDRRNPKLQEKINAILVSAASGPQPTNPSTAEGARFLAGPLLATLACHGTNAAVFAPAIRRLCHSKDPSLTSLTNLATRTLERIDPRPAS
jgi:hypothetical protein